VNVDYNKELLWEENFVGQKSAALDPSIWNLDLGDGSHIGLVGWGNNEREFYTADSITIDGALTISAQRQPADNPIQAYYGPAEWTSGKMHTANKVGFTYGLLEIKAKMPQGQGTWPALWLLGSSLVHGTSWPQCGEIDIFEGTGAHPYQVQGTIHGDGYFGENGLTQIIQNSVALHEDFHTYGINWSKDRIEWLFDGAVYNVIERSDPRLSGKAWSYNEEFYLIINLAIGGWFAGEVDPALESAQLLVESIKYFSVNGVGTLTLN